LPAVAKIGSRNTADAILNSKQCTSEIPWCHVTGYWFLSQYSL